MVVRYTLGLIDKASDISLECVGNKLYLYAAEYVYKREKLQSFFDRAEYLSGLLYKNTVKM